MILLLKQPQTLFYIRSFDARIAIVVVTFHLFLRLSSMRFMINKIKMNAI